MGRWHISEGETCLGVASQWGSSQWGTVGGGTSVRGISLGGGGDFGALFVFG